MRHNQQSQFSQLIVNNNAVVAKTSRFRFPELFFGKLASRLNDWYFSRKHCDYLLNLPDYLLDDIGIAREQLVKEGSRSFWEKGIFD
jgi:uncharacterized protein YjiS (DUF1127 family)